jgi:putative endonuclease
VILLVIPGHRAAMNPEPMNTDLDLLSYYVYLLASRKYGTLYLDVTNDLVRRVWEHRNKVVPGFSNRYDVDRLVWYEIHQDVAAAIAREKEIKKWRRDWKIALIEADNPDWNDLFEAIAA